jgi:hypothetical protein
MMAWVDAARMSLRESLACLCAANCGLVVMDVVVMGASLGFAFVVGNICRLLRA